MHLCDEQQSQYVGCAHEKFAKSSLPNSLFCYWLLFGVIWWIGWLKSEETRHIGNLTIYLFNKQEFQLHVEEPNTATTELGTSFHADLQPGHTLLWDGIPFFNQRLSQVSKRGCVGHSGTNSFSKPKLIPQVLNGVDSGLLADHSILSTPKFWR